MATKKSIANKMPKKTLTMRGTGNPLGVKEALADMAKHKDLKGYYESGHPRTGAKAHVERDIKKFK